MMAGSEWLRQTRRTYFGNAAAQRDFRVQLRGNRSMLLFGLYLAILITVAYFKYGEIAGNSQISVVQAQRELRDFYTLIVSLLAGMVAIVTPGLAATTIVMERQRRSLDLVFSAPVAPRYYLVGKTIAVYRYIWMLLILSLPVTAACVVLGGASWSDVLTVYGLLSVHGLLFAAIGLLMSTVSSKPVAAVVWTYIAVAAYLFASTGASAAYSFRPMMAGGELPFIVGLSPFSAIFTVGTYTVMYGMHVPNYLLASLAILLGVRLCLLGAGSILSEGRETANLRIHWVLMAAACSFGFTFWLVAAGSYASMSPSTAFGTSDPHAAILGYGLFWVLTPIVLAIPTLAAYGDDGFIRQRNNGWFDVRRTFDGTPAGGLPYIFLLVLTTSVFGVLGVAGAGGKLPNGLFAIYVVYVMGFWGLFWAIARVASSYGIGLKAARTAVVAAIVLLVALPVPFLSAVSAQALGRDESSAWDFYLLRPILMFNHYRPEIAVGYGVGLLAVALGLNSWSEWNRKRLAVTSA